MKDNHQSRIPPVFWHTCLIVLNFIFFAPHITHAEQSSKTTTLRSASELDYPPFAIVRPDGTADGFSVELLKAVVNAVDLQVNISIGPWHQLKEDLADGRLDVLPLVAYTEERDKIYDFTVPYLQMHGAIFVRKETTSIRDVSDLQDKEVLVMRGDSAYEYATTHYLSSQLILADSYAEAMKLLSSGKHDAVLCQYLMGLQLVKQLGLENVVSVTADHEKELRPRTYKVSGFEQKFCFAVPEGNKEFLQDLNEGLSLVFANGTYQELYDKWFVPIFPPPPISVEEILKYSLVIVLPFLFLASLAGVWFLKREVNLRARKLEKEMEERTASDLRAKEALAKFQVTFEQAAVGIAHVATDGKWLYVNQKLCDVVGYSREEMLQKTFQNITHPDDRDVDLEYVRQMLADEISNYSMEKRYVRKDGSSLWARLTVSMAPKENSDTPYFISVIEDISKHKEAERVVLEEKGKAQVYLDVASFMFCALNVKGEVTLINPKGCEILKVARRDAIGKNWFDCFLPKRLINEVKEIFSKLMTGEIESVEYYENPILTCDGQERTIAFHNAVLKDSEGNLTGVLFSGNDITDIKVAEKEKIELQNRLYHAQKMEAIGTLAGGIAHDFNNALSPILGFTELVREEMPDGSQAKKDLDIVYKSAARASNLVRQILTFSRQDDSGELLPCSIIPLLKEFLKLLRSSLPSTISIEQNLCRDEMILHCNARQTHQLLMNLCTNASHAMEKKGGTLTVSLQHLKSNEIPYDFPVKADSYAELTMQDTGEGMDAMTLSRIFEPYFTTKPQGKGTGLGLAIVFGIINKIEGEIFCSSEEGKGTTFRLYLPTVERSEMLSVKQQTNTVLDGSNRKILVVDDEELITKWLKRQLEGLGFKVAIQIESEKALEFFRENAGEIDLVITDLTMPHMTGLQLAEEMHKVRNDIPLLLMTGFNNLEEAAEARTDGFFKGVLLKPFTKEDLAKSIESALTDSTSDKK